MNKPNILKSRIRLRPIVVQDIEIIRIWRNKDSIRKSFIYQEIISSEQQVSWWKRYCACDTDHMFIIEHINDNKPIGAIALYRIEYGEKAEFGRLMIGEEEYLGKGYAKEALQLINEYAVETLKLKQLYLEVFATNLAALQLYLKAGFVVRENKNGLITMVMELS